MATKIGRNEPCPCGSGKKYKRCCLGVKEDNIDMRPVIRWILENSDLKEKFDTFTTAKDKIDTQFLIDAFIFDYELPDGITPFQVFLKSSQLSVSERQDYEKLLANTYSLFQVKEIRIDEGMLLENVMYGGEYWVKEKKGTHGISVGQVVIFRIAQIGDDFVAIGPGGFIFDSSVAYSMKRVLNNGRLKDDNKKLSAIDVLNILCKERAIDKSVDELIADLKKKIRALGIVLSLDDIKQRINNNKDYKAAFPELFNFAYPSANDFKDVMELVMQLWNRYPRIEFKGKTPDAVYSAGPEERSLLSALAMEVQAAIDPDTYDTKAVLEEAIQNFQQKWFATPQKELDGKTPKEVILAERTRLGNPLKDIGVKIMVDKLPAFKEDEQKELAARGMKIQFKCNSCNKKQQLHVGSLIYVMDKKDDKFFFELETKCKHCGSYDLGSNELYSRAISNALRSMVSKSKCEDDIMIVPPELEAEGKRMHYSKILPYFERRIQEEPENPELHLRFANALRKFNKYPEAVQEYEKAIVLNQNLLAVYVNLINIYIHRFVQYKENGAQEKARAYLNKARELFGSQTANLVTIADKRVAEEWLKEYEQCLS